MADGPRGRPSPCPLSTGTAPLAGRAQEPQFHRHAPARHPDHPGSGRPCGAETDSLEPILDPSFLDSSFGFRPGRSVAGALASATRLLAADTSDALRFHFAVHLDVARCFDTIDHAILLAELGEHVSDDGLLRLVGQLIEVGGTTVRRLWSRRTCGIIQGSALSPLLCNLYLHGVDQELAALGRSTQGGVQALRYADDLLLVARDARLAQQAIALTRKSLARREQCLREPRARPRPIHEGVTWLGVHLLPRPNRWTGKVRFGYLVPDDRVLAMLDRIGEMTVAPSNRIDAAAFNLGRWIVSVNEQLREWHQAYVYADNGPEVFRTVDEYTRERIGALLNSVTGTRYRDLYDDYRVWLPRGFWTWQIQGSRLVVLSSLAPRCPRNLTRRPAWQHHSPKVRKQELSAPRLGAYVPGATAGGEGGCQKSAGQTHTVPGN